MKSLLKLQDHLLSLGPIAVAVSGGVDSMTLAVVAHRTNPDTQLFHAVSAAVPKQATIRVEKYAKLESWRLTLVDAGETKNPDYIANPANRCYFCKTNLYATLAKHTPHTLLSGTNLDDLSDYRPGLDAAAEYKVLHPYVDTGIDKATLRRIAKHLGLNDLFDLPAAPCLSSRIETGIEIDARVLPLINESEQAIWKKLQFVMPLKGVRCRIRKNGLAVELDTHLPIDPSAEYALEATKIIAEYFVDHGFASYTANITVEPYQRGSAFLIETLNLD